MMDIGEAFRSVYIVPVAGCVMVLGIVISAKVAEVKKRQLEYEERMSALAKGLPLPPLESEARASMIGAIPGINPQVAQIEQMQQTRRKGGIRRAGIVLVALAIGIMVFFASLAWILREHDVLSGVPCGLIPLAIGIGLLVDAHITGKEQEALAEASGSQIRVAE